MLCDRGLHRLLRDSDLCHCEATKGRGSASRVPGLQTDCGCSGGLCAGAGEEHGPRYGIRFIKGQNSTILNVNIKIIMEIFYAEEQPNFHLEKILI